MEQSMTGLHVTLRRVWVKDDLVKGVRAAAASQVRAEGGAHTG